MSFTGEDEDCAMQHKAASLGGNLGRSHSASRFVSASYAVRPALMRGWETDKPREWAAYNSSNRRSSSS